MKLKKSKYNQLFYFDISPWIAKSLRPNNKMLEAKHGSWFGYKKKLALFQYGYIISSIDTNNYV